MINTAQFICINDRESHPINSLERQPVISELTASAAFGKQKSKMNIILLNAIFHNLSTEI